VQRRRLSDLLAQVGRRVRNAHRDHSPNC
jgi:hypothetical protein